MHRVAPADAQAGSQRADPVRARGHRVEADASLDAVLLDDRRARARRCRGRSRRTSRRPVEPLADVGPRELLERLLVAAPQGDQQVTCLAVPLRRAHPPCCHRAGPPRNLRAHGGPLGDVRLGPVAAAERGIGQRLGDHVDDEPLGQRPRGRAPRPWCGHRRRRPRPAPRRRRMPGRSPRAPRRARPARPAPTGWSPAGARGRYAPAGARARPRPRCRGSSRPKQAPSGRDSSVPANRCPPRWVHSQTWSGSARARVATIGRPRTAQQASRMPWVHTSTIGSASSWLADRAVPEGAGRVEQVGRGAPGAPHPGAAHRVDGEPVARPPHRARDGRGGARAAPCPRTTRRGPRPRHRPGRPAARCPSASWPTAPGAR